MDPNNQTVISYYAGKPLIMMNFQYDDKPLPKKILIGLINVSLNHGAVKNYSLLSEFIDPDIFIVYNSAGEVIIIDTRYSIITKDKINKNNLSKIPEELTKIFNNFDGYKLYGGKLRQAFSQFLANLK